MSYEQMMKELNTTWNVSFSDHMILADIKHMLVEFKGQKKFSLIKQSHRKELIELMHMMHDAKHRPRSWDYSSYFRLKYLYLKELYGEL